MKTTKTIRELSRMAACMALALAWAALAQAQGEPGPERLSFGSVTAERLGMLYEDGAGPYVSVRGGDWRLSNEHVTLTFVDAFDRYTTVSQPLGGLQPTFPQPSKLRVPGALCDVAVDGQIIDLLTFITQGLGPAKDGPVIRYDSIEAVSRDNALGIRVQGSPEDRPEFRIETTWWLSPGDRHVEIVSRWLEYPEASILPLISDVAQWNDMGSLYAVDKAFAPAGEPSATETPLFSVADGGMCVGLRASQGNLKGLFSNSPARSRTVAAGDAPAMRKPDAVFTRELLLAAGSYSDVLQQAVKREYGDNTGRIDGVTLHYITGAPEPNALMSLERIVPNDEGGKDFFPYTQLRSDDEGKFTINLPGGEYIAKSVTWGKRRANTSWYSVDVEPGAIHPYKVRCVPQPSIHVRVVDADTSEPLAARLRFEALPGTAPINWGNSARASGFLQYAYLPPEGASFELPLGEWILHATHGLQYGKNDVHVTVDNDEVLKYVIPLAMESPTPGWIGVEVGMRTDATPGCAITPEDAVLMAAGEDLDWIVTGDYNVVTDLTPVIEAMGLDDRLKATCGFRTILPAHPGWGPFLIFPIGPDDPDPAEVCGEWTSLTEASDFIATLRRLYPNSVIQSDLPYNEQNSKHGYFAIKNRAAPFLSYYPRKDIDLGIDAVSLYRSRFRCDIIQTLEFAVNNEVSGRVYLAMPSYSGRIPNGGEPGYPRLLVRTGQSNVTLVDEEQLLGDIRERRTQVTSGPFVDFTVAGNGPGQSVDFLPLSVVKTCVNALPGIPVMLIHIQKEGKDQRVQQLTGGNNQVKRHPMSREAYEVYTLSMLKLCDWKDTMLNVFVEGGVQIDPDLPVSRGIVQAQIFCVTSPILVDRRGDGKFDPLAKYRDIGQ